MHINIDLKVPGIGLILSIIFAVLKLTGVVDWSWLIVCLPMIIGTVIAILLIIIMFIFMNHIMKKM